MILSILLYRGGVFKKGVPPPLTHKVGVNNHFITYDIMNVVLQLGA